MNDATRGRVKVEAGRKRVRAYLGGQLVVDTIRPQLVWESPYYPTYYIPAGDVKAQLAPTGKTEHSPSRGEAELFDVVVEGKTAESAARRYAESPLEELRELVRLDFDAMSQWFEEDEPIFVHARSPYTRVDILASSRHIRVEIDGVTVADSHQPRIVFETGLRPRYYLPLTDVRMDLLRSSDTETHCPYKGTANYYSVDSGTAVHEDVVWYYRTPLPESQKIAGLAAFYNEKLDIYVDGVLEDRKKGL
jgi:uncharacterized protein (DUF427 family)